MNRIKWDSSFDEKEFTVHYYDRIKDKLIAMPFVRIKEFSKSFFSLEDSEIPLHRIREIRRKSKLVWSRP
ncbi:MAG: DUF504 domain-containing protein [Candidatus Woesearchaeota archaeon]